MELDIDKITDLGKSCSYNVHGADVEYNEGSKKIYIGFEYGEYVTELDRNDVEVLMRFLDEHKDLVD